MIQVSNEKALDEEPRMSLDVWFREDVLRALRMARALGLQAQAEERRVMGGPDEILEAYWRGHLATLRSLGLAFGIRAPEIDDVGEISGGYLPPGRPPARIVIAVPRRPVDVEEEAYGD
jgi:hypothetical protein